MAKSESLAGGVWRTTDDGRHIYIKGGQAVAGLGEQAGKGPLVNKDGSVTTHRTTIDSSTIQDVKKMHQSVHTEVKPHSGLTRSVAEAKAEVAKIKVNEDTGKDENPIPYSRPDKRGTQPLNDAIKKHGEEHGEKKGREILDQHSTHEMVPFTDIVSNQYWIHPGTLKTKIDQVAGGTPNTSSIWGVKRPDGKVVLMDGNHTAAAIKLLGAHSVSVKIFRGTEDNFKG